MAESCSCGCGSITIATTEKTATASCECGCSSGTSVGVSSTNDAIAELKVLRERIDVRLAQLEPQVVNS